MWFTARKYQVTAMKVSDKYLYVGTTSGCVIVADAVELKPYTVFCCHSNDDFYVRTFVPMQENEQSDSQFMKHSIPHGIVTVGKGYRDLILKPEAEIEHSSLQAFANRPGSPRKYVKNPTYILSWHAKNWEYYWAAMIQDLHFNKVINSNSIYVILVWLLLNKRYMYPYNTITIHHNRYNWAWKRN